MDNKDILKRKQEILLRNRKNKIFDEYKSNQYCKVLGFSEDVINSLYSKYFKEIIKINNSLFNSKLELNNFINKEGIKHWILDNILINTVNNDIINISHGEFGLKLELINSELFFSNELQKGIDNHIGLDYGYINENRNFMHIFDDNEHYVYEYFKKYDN